jgi:hypothetical protein
MAKVKAYVYKVPGVFDSSYRVYPAVVVLSANDKFQLVNTVDDHDAELSVPEGVFDGGEVKKEKVARKSASTEKTPKNAIVSAQYKVHIDGEDASGNSDPVIIIDP